MKPLYYYNVLLNDVEFVAICNRLVEYYLVPYKKFDEATLMSRRASKLYQCYRISSQLFNLLCFI